MVLFGAIEGETVLFLDLEHSRHNLLLQSTKRGTAKQQRSISEAMNTLKDPHIINFSERSAEHANVTISFIDDDQTIIFELINVRLAHRFVCEINGMVENDSIKLRLQGVWNRDTQNPWVLLRKLSVKQHCSQEIHHRFALSSCKSHSDLSFLVNSRSKTSSHAHLKPLRHKIATITFLCNEFTLNRSGKLVKFIEEIFSSKWRFQVLCLIRLVHFIGDDCLCFSCLNSVHKHERIFSILDLCNPNKSVLANTICNAVLKISEGQPQKFILTRHVLESMNECLNNNCLFLTEFADLIENWHIRVLEWEHPAYQDDS